MTWVGVVFAASLPAIAWSQGAAPEAATEPSSDAMDDIVVLGSRRSDLTSLTSATPIDVVSAAKLSATGASTLSKALQLSVPSFHFPQETPSTSVQYAVRGASLHGMAPDQVLILVNGVRYHRNSQVNTGYLGYGRGTQIVDIDSIPVSAIERVEILRDGASAQYGSDAIAGVINIILKKKEQGGEVSALTGGYTKGDGFKKEGEGWYGFALPNGGSLTAAAVGGQTDPSDIAIDDTRQMYFAGDPRESTINRHWFYGSGKVQKLGASANAEMPLTDRLTAYASTVAARRENWGFANFRRPLDDNNVRAIYPDGFQPIQKVTSDDLDVAAGLRFGDAEGLGDLNFSVQWGTNDSAIETWNTLNASLGTASPTSGRSGATINTDLNIGLDHTKAFTLSLLPNPITFGSGLAYRHEKYEIEAGDTMTWVNGGVPILDGPNAGKATQSGSQGASGFQPSDASVSSRHVVGGYLSLESNLTDRFQVGLSGRAEDYSDFGSTTDGKLSLRYEFAPAFAVRGTASTGYRAPSIGQINYSRTTGIFVNGVQQLQRIIPVTSPAALALGAEPLKPETSRNYSLGFVLQPFSDAVLTIDAYQIEVDDRILLTGTLTGTFVSNILAAAGYPQLYGAQFFTNGLDTRTRGVDAVARKSFELPLGNLSLTLAFSKTDTDITGTAPTPAPLAGSGLVLIDRQQRAFVESGAPATKLAISSTYVAGALSVTPSVVRYGKYDMYQTTATYDQTFSPQWVANLTGTYAFTDNFKVAAGVNNIFNSYPDKQVPGARNPTVSEYSNLAPEGANGTSLYLRASLVF